MPRCFKMNPADNVGTLLDDVSPGAAVHVLGESSATVSATEAMQLGHKVALEAIAVNAPVVKFGVPIGHASQAIVAGQWVHLHNCSSNFDERSQTLDLHTGAATDTKYE